MNRRFSPEQEAIIAYAVREEGEQADVFPTSYHSPEMEILSLKERIIILGLSMAAFGAIALASPVVRENYLHPHPVSAEGEKQEIEPPVLFESEQDSIYEKKKDFEPFDLVPNRLLMQLGPNIDIDFVSNLKQPVSFEDIEQSDPQLAFLLDSFNLGVASVAPIFPEELLSSLDEKDREELRRWVTLEFEGEMKVDKDLPRLMEHPVVKQAIVDGVIAQITPESLKFPDDDGQNNEESSLAMIQWHLDQVAARGKNRKDGFKSDSELHSQHPEGVLAVIIDTGVNETIVWGDEKTAVPTIKIAVNKDEILGNDRDDDNDGIVDNKNLGGNFTTFPATADTSDINEAPHGTGTATAAHAHPETSLDRLTDTPVAVGKVCRLGFGGVGCPDTAIVQAIIYFLNEAEKEDLRLVINVSLGGPYDSPLVRKVIELAWESGRVVFVASAGNQGEDINENSHYPASYPLVIAVGAIGPDRQRKFYSNYGDKVIYAPSGIPVILPEADQSLLLNTPPPRGIAGLPSGLVNEAHGTSFSSPQVEGLATEVWQRHPNLTNTQVVEVVTNSVMADGIINVEKAFQLADEMAKAIRRQERIGTTPIAYSGGLTNYLFVHGVVKLEASLVGLAENDNDKNITWSVKAKPWITNASENNSWQVLLSANGRQLSADFDTTSLPTGWHLFEIAATRGNDNFKVQELRSNYALVLVNNEESKEMEFLAGCQVSSVSVATDTSGERVFAFTALGRETCVGIPGPKDNIGYLYLLSEKGKLLHKVRMPTDVSNPWWGKENLWPFPYPPATHEDRIAVVSYGIQSTYSKPPYHQNYSVQVFDTDGKLVFQDNIPLETEAYPEFFARQWATPPVFTENGKLLLAAHGKLYRWDSEGNRIELEVDATKVKNLAVADSVNRDKMIIFGGQMIGLESGTTIARLADFFRYPVTEYGPTHAADVDMDGSMEAISIVDTDQGKFVVVWNAEGIVFHRQIESGRGLQLVKDPRDGSPLILLTHPLVVLDRMGKPDLRFPALFPKRVGSAIAGSPPFANNPVSLPDGENQIIYLAPGRNPRVKITSSGQVLLNYDSPLSIGGINGLTCLTTKEQMTCLVSIDSNIQKWRLGLSGGNRVGIFSGDSQVMSPLGPGNRANFR